MNIRQIYLLAYIFLHTHKHFRSEKKNYLSSCTQKHTHTHAYTTLTVY